MIDTKEIYRLASEFRAAIEKTSFDKPPMDHFPHGACGDSSLLLSEYLTQHGYKSRYYCGEHAFGGERNSQTHAWVILENGIFVDITGDQFKNKPEFLNYDAPVYVGEKNDFFELFSIPVIEREGGIEVFKEHDPRAESRYRLMYNRIIQNLD